MADPYLRNVRGGSEIAVAGSMLQKLALSLMFLASGAAQLAVAQSKYTVHDLGTTDFLPLAGINRLGQVAVTAVGANNQLHGFRTAPNSPINPSTDDLGGLNCTAPPQVVPN